MVQAKQQAGNLVSFKLSDFSAGGALPDGLYEMQEPEIVLWDYDGKISGNTLALHSTMQPIDKSGKPVGDAIPQYWSIGDPDHFKPSETGTGIVAVGTRTSLGKGSNFYLFLENLIGAGFPEDRYDNDCSVLNGLWAEFVQIPQPKRSGLPQSNLVQGEARQERERNIPVPKVIVKLPWVKAGKAGVAAPKGKAAPKQEAEEAEPTEGETDLAGMLAPILEANPKGIDRTQARLKLFRDLRTAGLDEASRNEIMAGFADDDTLNGNLEALGFTLKGKNIVPA